MSKPNQVIIKLSPLVKFTRELIQLIINKTTVTLGLTKVSSINLIASRINDVSPLCKKLPIISFTEVIPWY